MPKAAQFRAGDFILARLCRRKPNFNAHSGHCILLHAKVGKEKAMDHVLGTKTDSNRLSDWDMHDSLTEHILLRHRIVALQTNAVCRRDELGVRPPKLSVR